jgi:ATP-binding cassette subfamily C protein LapB
LNSVLPTLDPPAVALNDPVLARLLARLAALQGRAVPAHRFGMSTAPNGVALEGLPRVDRAEEIWTSLFPECPPAIRLTDPKRVDFPLLWIPTNEAERPLLVRGGLASGALVAQSEDGENQVLERRDQTRGVLLRLRVSSERGSDTGEDLTGTTEKVVGPRSAREWFAYAIRQRRRVFIEASVATTVYNLLALATSLYSLNVYDRVIPTQGWSTLWVLSIGAFLGVIFEFVMREIRAIMVDRACKEIDLELSGVFFGKALSIRMDRRPSTIGTFAAQIRQFETVRNTLTSTTLFFLADMPFALFFIGVIALIAGKVALVPLALVPVAVLTGFAHRRRIQRLTALQIEESNQRNGVLIEAIDGIESIKAAQGEWKQLERWQSLNESLSTNELALRHATTQSAAAVQSVQQLTYIAMIAAGAVAIGAGELTMGGLIACSIISGRAMQPIAMISNLIGQWAQAHTSLRSLDAIMALPSDGPDEVGARPLIPEQTNGELALEEVRYVYGSRVDANLRRAGAEAVQGATDLVALNVPKLRIAAGERVAILGPVGSGKSTLIKVLSGLYRPQSGRVFLGGLDMALLAPEFVREHVGYLPQDVRLFQGTLRENLTIGLPSPSDEQILQAARLTGLEQAIAAHPKGLSLEISEGGRGLSGGQRQLVGLTRLLIAQPSVVLLDEPTASMDSDLERFVMSRLASHLRPDAVLVIVTHKAALLQHVSRILVVDRGRLALDGPRDAVLSRLAAPASPPPTGA